MAVGGNEALARDTISDQSSSLGAAAYGFAGALGARYGDFGAYRELSAHGLVEQVYDRWAMSDRLTNGIEIFDTDALGTLASDWSVSPGYWDTSLTDSLPFVTPVDPVAHVRGLSARQARSRGRRRNSMFAVPTPREQERRHLNLRGQRAPENRASSGARPIERWRAVDDTRLTAYPKSMGNAGAVDASLLKFADARARVQHGSRTAIVASPSPGVDWSSGDGLAPAARRAELMLEDLGNRLSPAKPSAVTHWLVPADTTPDIAEQIANRHVSTASARWSQIGNVSVAPIASPAQERHLWREGAGVLIEPRPDVVSPPQSAAAFTSENDGIPSIGDSRAARQDLEQATLQSRAVEPTVKPWGRSPTARAASLLGARSRQRPRSRFLRAIEAGKDDRVWPPLPPSVSEIRTLGDTILAGTTRWSTTALDTGLDFVDALTGSQSIDLEGVETGNWPLSVLNVERDTVTNGVSEQSVSFEGVLRRARFDAPAGPWDRAGVLLSPSKRTSPQPSTEHRVAFSRATVIAPSMGHTTRDVLASPGVEKLREAQLERSQIIATGPQSVGSIEPPASPQLSTSPYQASSSTHTRRPIVAMLERLLGRWTAPDQPQPVIAAAARTVSRILNQLNGESLPDATPDSMGRRAMDLYTETGAFVTSLGVQSGEGTVAEDALMTLGTISSVGTRPQEGQESIPAPTASSSTPLFFDPRLTAGGGIVIAEDPSALPIGPTLPATVTALLASQGVDLESPWISWVDRLDAKLNEHFGHIVHAEPPVHSALANETETGVLIRPQATSAAATETITSSPMRRPSRARLAPTRPTGGDGISRSRPQRGRRGQAPLVSRPSPDATATPHNRGASQRGQSAHRLMQRGMGRVVPRKMQDGSIGRPVPTGSAVGRIAALGESSPAAMVAAVSPYAGWPTHLIHMVEDYGADPTQSVFFESVGFGRDPERVVVSTDVFPNTAGSAVSQTALESREHEGFGRARPRVPGTTAMAVLDLSERLSDARPNLGLSHRDTPQYTGRRTIAGTTDPLGSDLVRVGPKSPASSPIQSSMSSAATEGTSRRPAPPTTAGVMDVFPVAGRVTGQGLGKSIGRSSSRRRPRNGFADPMSLTVPLTGKRTASTRSVSTMDVLSLVSQTVSPIERRAPGRLAALWTAAVQASRPAEALGGIGGERAGRPEWATVQVGRSAEPSIMDGSGNARPSTTMVTPDNVSRALVAYGRAHAAAGGGVGSPGEVGVALNRAGRHVDRGRPRTKPKAPMSFVESPRTPGKLFGDRGPAQVKAPQDKPRVLVDTSHAEPLTEAMMRSTGADLARTTETDQESRHKLASQTEGDLSPEEIEQIADEVITQLRREAEFDRLRLGDDEWD